MSRDSGLTVNRLWRQRVDDRADVAALRGAWRAVTARHPALSARSATGRLANVTYLRADPDLAEQVAMQLRARSPEFPEAPAVRAVLVRVDDRAELMLSARADVLNEAAGAALLGGLLAGGCDTSAAPRVTAAQRPTDHSGQTHSSAEATGRRPGPSLTVLRGSGRPHLHLFHPGGGGTFSYLALVAALPAQWAVSASDDPGTGDSVGELVDIYLRDLRDTRTVPDILGGWSLGGLLALEAGRRLADDGRARIPALVLLDTPLPGTAGDMPGPPRLNLEFIGMLWTNLRLSRCYIAELDAGDDVDLAARLVHVGVAGAGEDIEVDLLRQQLDVFRRHRRALVSYAGPETVATPALTVAATSEPDLTAQWSRWLSAPTVIRLPAGHYELLRPPRVGQVAQLITAWWSRVDGG